MPIYIWFSHGVRKKDDLAAPAFEFTEVRITAHWGYSIVIYLFVKRLCILKYNLCYLNIGDIDAYAKTVQHFQMSFTPYSDVRFTLFAPHLSQAYFCQSLPTLQLGLSAIADLLVSLLRRLCGLLYRPPVAQTNHKRLVWRINHHHHHHHLFRPAVQNSSYKYQLTASRTVRLSLSANNCP